MTQCIRKRFSLQNFPVKVQFNFVELRKDEFSFFRESSIHFLSGEAPRIRYDGRFLNVIGRKGGITKVFEGSLITVVVDQYLDYNQRTRLRELCPAAEILPFYFSCI